MERKSASCSFSSLDKPQYQNAIKVVTLIIDYPSTNFSDTALTSGPLRSTSAPPTTTFSPWALSTCAQVTKRDRLVAAFFQVCTSVSPQPINIAANKHTHKEQLCCLATSSSSPSSLSATPASPFTSNLLHLRPLALNFFPP